MRAWSKALERPYRGWEAADAQQTGLFDWLQCCRVLIWTQRWRS